MAKQKKSKKDINKALKGLSLKGVKPEKGDAPSRPPEGTFALKIKKTEITLSKNDNAMIVYDIIIAKGSAKGKKFRKFALLNADRLAYALGDLETLGIDLPKKASDWNETVAEARGLCVEGTITHQDDGKNFNCYFNELIEDLGGYETPVEDDDLEPEVDDDEEIDDNDSEDDDVDYEGDDDAEDDDEVDSDEDEDDLDADDDDDADDEGADADSEDDDVDEPVQRSRNGKSKKKTGGKVKSKTKKKKEVVEDDDEDEEPKKKKKTKKKLKEKSKKKSKRDESDYDEDDDDDMDDAFDSLVNDD